MRTSLRVTRLRFCDIAAGITQLTFPSLMMYYFTRLLFIRMIIFLRPDQYEMHVQQQLKIGALFHFSQMEVRRPDAVEIAMCPTWLLKGMGDNILIGLI